MILATFKHEIEAVEELHSFVCGPGDIPPQSVMVKQETGTKLVFTWQWHWAF